MREREREREREQAGGGRRRRRRRKVWEEEEEEEEESLFKADAVKEDSDRDRATQVSMAPPAPPGKPVCCVSGVRGFPGRGRRKILSLFFLGGFVRRRVPPCYVPRGDSRALKREEAGQEASCW